MKPVPQAEIVVEILQTGSETVLLHITTNSNDAYQFVKQHAPEYGNYFAPDEFQSAHRLFVRAGYKATEVAEYLKAMVAE
jgi:hypothetical protein